MKLKFEQLASLPRLSWCARMRRHEAVAHIRHGSWVETRDDCFFEGAWDGPLEAYRFDEAIMLAGSGARVVNGAILFASPGPMCERLYSLSVANELYVSNSFAFLLTQAGQQLDINYPNYFFDFLYHHQCGIRVTKKPIRIQGGRYAYLHDYCNILVKPDLTITRIEKNPGDPPRDYSDYVAFLEGSIKSICENAMHPARKQTYRPLTTISQGYDSPAVSVLAARAGCREAVTFRKSVSDDGYVDDCGTTIAGYLGLQTTEYERLDFNKLSGLPTAEFYLNPFAMTEALAVMEDQFVGSLLITGNWGDNVWSTDKQSGWSLLQMPHMDYLAPATTMVDFRLRVGFVLLAPATCGALHCPAIRRITQSREMMPWSVGGDYDRPIARRIIEEAGVPRELFARHKMKGAPWSPRGFSLSSPEGDRDFEAFYLTKVAGNTGRRSSASAGKDVRKRKINWQRPLRKLLRRFPVRIRRALMWHRLDPRWGSKHLYRFHWGLERTQERYQSALSQNR
jgi:hypothetical protein